MVTKICGVLGIGADDLAALPAYSLRQQAAVPIPPQDFATLVAQTAVTHSAVESMLALLKDMMLVDPDAAIAGGRQAFARVDNADDAFRELRAALESAVRSDDLAQARDILGKFQSLYDLRKDDRADEA